MMTLGNEAHRIDEGVLSRGFNPEAFSASARATTSRHQRTPSSQPLGESQFRTVDDPNASSEILRRALDLRTSQKMERRPQTTISADPLQFRDRLTGPIQFINNLLKVWKLKPDDAVLLLGFERSDKSYVDSLLNGRVTLMGRDIKDRIAYLFQIRRTLSALFLSEDTENEWLREPHSMLNDQVLIDLLLEGAMENLLLVKEYVDMVAGR